MDLLSVLNGLDLFSGIGGLSLALSPWVWPVAYCENDRYAQAVLLSRMGDALLPNRPIWDDIKTFPGSEFKGKVDIIYGGFPCQDISVAGHGAGLDGERSGLFFELVRIVEETRPTFVFLENVPAIRTRGLDRVIREFSYLQYDLRWTRVSAAEVGAPHIRQRWFLLAHHNYKRSDQNSKSSSDSHSKTLRIEPRRRIWKGGKLSNVHLENGDSWLSTWTSKGGFKPRVFRTGNGVSNAVDRDKALGNAVVPLQAREAFMRLMGLQLR